MTEYVEIVKILALLNDLVNECSDKEEFFNRAFDAVDGMRSSSDVVPKSEVDKWKSISEQIHKEMSERVVEERKIERNIAVAQIIGEILSRHTPDCDGFLTMHTGELPEIKKKYTEGHICEES